jgi:hypothetical protein
MSIILGVALGILYCSLLGLFCYITTITIIPDKYKDKLFSIIPFFPKTIYSIILYLLSGILYSLFAYLFHFSGIISALLCVIISSLFVKMVAKLRKDNLEYTYEEELKRKRGF